MKEIKIIFFDIDGTLIDMDQKQISEKMLETLIRLKEKNIILCLATGRGPTCLPSFDGIEFDAFLTFNGSYSFTKQETIFSNPIPPQDIKTIIANATSINRPVSIATKDRVASNGKDKDLVDYARIANEDVHIAYDFDQVAQEDVFQIMAGSYEREYPQMMKNVHGAKITAWWNRAVDIIPADSGKGNAVEKVLAYYHLDKTQAMAFGDGNNDIEMLQAVGHGIAMKNGSDELKEIASDICGHVAEDGIYHYCEKHGLI